MERSMYPKLLAKVGSILGEEIERLCRLEPMLVELRGRQGEILKEIHELKGAVHSLGETLGGAEGRAVRAQLSAVNEGIEALKQGLNELYAKNELLERASREQERLSEENYSHRVIQPLARDVIAILSDVGEVQAGGLNGDGAGFLEGLEGQLSEILYRFGFDGIPCREGDAFDPEWMRPVGEIATPDRAKHRTVARVYQRGFERQGWKHHARVMLYSYDGNGSNRNKREGGKEA